MKDKIPEITEIMKKLDKMRDEAPSQHFKDEVKDIVEKLSELRDVMNY